MRTLWWILLWMGCQPMEAGQPFEPVALEPCECECEVCPDVDATADGEDTTTDDAAPEAGSDDEETDVEPAGAEGDPFAAALQDQEPPETAEPDPEGEAVVPANQPWTPSITGPSWGVRLVSVVPGANPPQAVLGLSDGSSEVVQAGDMLPSVGVVVLAIGKDRVQLVQVKPAGDHATVESLQLSAMYPSSP